MALPRHCDDYIDDENEPLIIRRFLRYHRWPAVYQIRARRYKVKQPKLFADLTPCWLLWWRKVRVKVVFASRMGDVGVSRNLKDNQYRERVWMKQLSNFSEVP